MNEDDCVHHSRLRLNMSSKESFVPISVTMPSKKYYDGFLIPVFAYSNPLKKASDSSSSVALVIVGPLCSVRMRFDSWMTISRIASFSFVVMNGSEMDGLTAAAEAHLIVGSNEGPSVFNSGVSNRLFLVPTRLRTSFRLTEGHQKRSVCVVSHVAFMVACHCGQLRVEHMRSCPTSVFVLQHVYPNFEVLVLVFELCCFTLARFAVESR